MNPHYAVRRLELRPRDVKKLLDGSFHLTEPRGLSFIIHRIGAAVG